MSKKFVFAFATAHLACRKHDKWRIAVKGSRVDPRYANCIYADQEVIDSVLHGDEPGSKHPMDIVYPKAFVKILDDLFEEQPEQLNSEDEEDEKAREMLNRGDEGKPDIEVSRLLAKGWT